MRLHGRYGYSNTLLHEQGWDPGTGVPTAETLRALEVEEDAAHAV